MKEALKKPLFLFVEKKRISFAKKYIFAAFFGI